MFGQQNITNQQSNDDNDTTSTMGDLNSQIPAVPAPEPQVATEPPSFVQPVSAPVVQPTSTDVTKVDGLLEIKQKALQDLSPLVKHLDQSPVDKFKTTMMMIQASDDKTLIPDAYEMANAIEDSKEKAQALLDVVNEINYFTNKDVA